MNSETYFQKINKLLKRRENNIINEEKRIVLLCNFYMTAAFSSQMKKRLKNNCDVVSAKNALDIMEIHQIRHSQPIHVIPLTLKQISPIPSEEQLFLETMPPDCYNLDFYILLLF